MISSCHLRHMYHISTIGVGHDTSANGSATTRQSFIPWSPDGPWRVCSYLLIVKINFLPQKKFSGKCYLIQWAWEVIHIKEHVLWFLPWIFLTIYLNIIFKQLLFTCMPIFSSLISRWSIGCLFTSSHRKDQFSSPEEIFW